MTRSGTLSTIRRWLPVILWCVAILAVSSIPGRTISRVGLQVPDKLVHALEYAVLGFLALRQQWAEPSIGRRRAVVTALVLGVAVGAFDETYQRLVPQRDASFGDLLADTTGVMVGVSLAAWRYRWRPRSLASTSSGEPT